MKKVNDMAQYSALAMPHIRAKAVTNCFDSPSQLNDEINNNRLFYEKGSDYLLLFYKRDGFYKLKFYAQQNSTPVYDTNEKMVCEIASKSGFEIYGGILNCLGFEKTGTRLRYTIPSLKGTDLLYTLCDTEIKDEQSDHGVISSTFDKYTGCIPLGKITCLCAYKSGELAGVLHYLANEICHLAVLPSFRSQGTAKALIYALSSKTGKNIKVWTAHSNTAARALYEKCGAVADGYTSIIAQKNF